MLPAVFELLVRRIRVWDRKAQHGAAMICAEVWNSAGKTIDRDKRPDPFVAADFLPELPEERRQREAEEEVLRNRPQESQAFATFKSGLMALAEETPAQKAARAALVKRNKP